VPTSRISPVYAHTHNALLSFLREKLPPGDPLPVQAELAVISGASRTTIHRILRSLKKSGLLEGAGGGMRLARRPLNKDFLPQPQLLSRREHVEKSLMNMLIEGRLRPGERFSELALARQHDVTTGTIREALLRLSHLGVLHKSERKQWTVARIDAEMINELMDVRILIETYALKNYFRKGEPAQRVEFLRIQAETQQLADAAQADREKFFQLDTQLHNAILESAHNRYLTSNFQFTSFPIQIQFLHHDFDGTLQRIGLNEHLARLAAISAGDRARSLELLEDHLETARQTLLKFESHAP